MNNRTVILLSVLLSVVVFLFHFSAKKQPSDDEAKMFDFMDRSRHWQGRLAPDFTLDLLNGGKFALAEQAGKKVIVLNFFATWCGPCKEEIPELVRFYEKHKDEPFVFIGIDADEPENDVQDFIRDYGVTYPVAIDRGGKIQRTFSVRAYPTTVFIGADGTVHLYEIGPIMNADVAFDAFYKSGMEMVRQGTGITKEAFLQKQKEHKEQKASGPAVSTAPEEKSEPEENAGLIGRPRAIAEKMHCPCGCTHTLMECTCKTAKDVKESLKKRDLSAMTDEEVIKALNREFCMK